MGCGIAAAEDHGGITAKNGAPVRAVHILIISAVLKSAHERLEGRSMRISAQSAGRAAREKRRSGRESGKRNFAKKPFDKWKRL